jgi:hypothetical protein
MLAFTLAQRIGYDLKAAIGGGALDIDANRPRCADADSNAVTGMGQVELQRRHSRRHHGLTVGAFPVSPLRGVNLTVKSSRQGMAQKRTRSHEPVPVIRLFKRGLGHQAR